MLSLPLEGALSLRRDIVHMPSAVHFWPKIHQSSVWNQRILTSEDLVPETFAKFEIAVTSLHRETVARATKSQTSFLCRAGPDQPW